MYRLKKIFKEYRAERYPIVKQAFETSQMFSRNIGKVTTWTCLHMVQTFLPHAEHDYSYFWLSLGKEFSSGQDNAKAASAMAVAEVDYQDVYSTTAGSVLAADREQVRDQGHAPAKFTQV